MAETEKEKILVIGREPEILSKIVELINKNTDCSAEGALTDEETVRLFRCNSFGLVLIGAGIEPGSDKILRNIFKAERPGIKIIQHFGGGSGLLYQEIKSALETG